MSDALDSLMSSGSPSAKFPEIGTVVKGEILRIEETQQQDYSTGKPKFWDDGNPMMQHVITLKTEERDPDIPNDDGERRLFARGQMRAAITAAIRDSRADRTQIIGGTLAVQYASDGEPSKPGFNPPKQYVAQFKPATNVPTSLISDQPATAPAAAPAAPVAQPTASSLI